MDTFWTAIIGAIATIVAAIIPTLLSRQESLRNKSYDKVTGSINEPIPNETVPRTFKCSGLVTGMQPGLMLWLAVEAGDLVWPKEGHVVPDQNNKWSETLFEDGVNKIFSVALYVGNSKVDRYIEKWLEVGRRTGKYSELKGIPGARRLARIDGLRLN